MSKVKPPRGATHYFLRPAGNLAYFVDTKTGTVFSPLGNIYTKDEVWKGTEGIARLSGILTNCKMIQVNLRLENK